MKKILLFPLLLALFGCPSPESANTGAEDEYAIDTIAFTEAKNIILLIGDGMGLTQITAGMYSNGNRLHLEAFQFIGLHKPSAIDNLVTDSAAGATAFASGVKTYNGAIGVSADGKKLPTILEQASSRGMASGLVVTSSITHATPACFYAHQPERSMMEDIAADLVNSGTDFFVGGGSKWFTQRKDGRNLIEELQGKGFVISDTSKTDFKNISIDAGKKFGYFTAFAEPRTLAQGRDYFLQACQNAVSYLSNQGDKGFFLMIEGSQIDWGGHANQADYIISEMIEFDRAIGVALDFAKQDGETLVIVTADHETGGFAINPGSRMDSIVPDFTSKQHTGALIPVFAWGPGAELFSGIYQNTGIYEKMRLALGFKKT